jgi:flagellar protein FliS
MNAANGYAAYKNSKVMTASPAELTLMLYDGAIRFCNIAMSAIDENDVQKAHTNIRKADAILEEFQLTLDHKYEIAEDFDKVYKYLRERLMWANVKKDKEILEEVLVHLRTMRDTWKEVIDKNKIGSENANGIGNGNGTA